MENDSLVIRVVEGIELSVLKTARIVWRGLLIRGVVVMLEMIF